MFNTAQSTEATTRLGLRRQKHPGRIALATIAVIAAFAAWTAGIGIYVIGYAEVSASLELVAPADPGAPYVKPDDSEEFFLLGLLPMFAVIVTTGSAVVLGMWAAEVRMKEIVPYAVAAVCLSAVIWSMTMLIGVLLTPFPQDPFVEWAEARYGVDLSQLSPNELAPLANGDDALHTVVDIELDQTITSFTNGQGTILVDPDSTETAPDELPVVSR